MIGTPRLSVRAGCDDAKFRMLTDEIERAWGEKKPANTLIPVPRLALEGMEVEIDVIAAVPD